MIRPPIAVGGKRHVDGAIHECQGLALVLRLGVEHDEVVDAAVPVPGGGGGDAHRATGEVTAADDIHGMQVLNECGAARGTARHEIHDLPRRIDHRRPDDPDVAGEVVVGPAAGARHVGGPRRPHARRREVPLPVHSSVVSVIRIERVVDRGDIDHVARRVGDGEIADDQRLRVDMVIHRHAEQRAKLLHVDVARGQRRLVGVPTGSRVVIVLGQHGYRLRIRRARVRRGLRARSEQHKDQKQGKPRETHGRIDPQDDRLDSLT